MLRDRLEASDQEVSEAIAVQGLLAADAIVGTSTRARKRLDAHLDKLKKGSEEDKGVFRAFQEAIKAE